MLQWQLLIALLRVIDQLHFLFGQTYRLVSDVDLDEAIFAQERLRSLHLLCFRNLQLSVKALADGYFCDVAVAELS